MALITFERYHFQSEGSEPGRYVGLGLATRDLCFTMVVEVLTNYILGENTYFTTHS